MRTLFGLMSFWVFLLFFLMLALQAAPGSERLLDGAGAPEMTGWLFHFVLLALTADALLGRLSRAAIILPALFYASYYAAYWAQGRQIDIEARRLATTNPTKILDFDANKFSLAMDDADIFVSTHAVPIAYKHDPSFQPEEYVSYRLLPVGQIWSFIAAAPRSVQVLAVYWGDVKQPNVREVSTLLRPKNPLVSVNVIGSGAAAWQSWNIGHRTTEIVVAGSILGAFKTADIERLPAFPLLSIGCWSVDDAPRRCDANFVLKRQEIRSTPAGIDADRFDTPVSVMLGIPKYTDAELSAFQGYASNVAPSSPAPASSPASPEAPLATLQAVIEGRNPAVEWTTAYEIARDPKRLAPMAAAMAEKFLDYIQPKAMEIPRRREQAALLASALLALPPTEFAQVAESLSASLRAQGAWQDYPALYVRVAGASPTMFSFYRDRLLSHDVSRTEELLAALAICRIGQADGELLSALKTRWADSEAQAARDDDYRSALFVALVKLKQQDYLSTAARSASKLLQAWYDAVLAGRGETAVGPNNCMPMEWPLPAYLPSNFAPQLRWSRRQWTAETTR